MTLTTEHIALIGVFISAFAAIGGGIAYLFNRPKTHAETLKTLSETVNNLSRRVSELEAESQRDNERLQQMERLLSICIIGLNTLSGQLTRSGHKPEWTPPNELVIWIEDTKHVHH